MTLILSRTTPRVSLMGSNAVFFEAPGEMSLPTQRRIWALARRVSGIDGVREAAPGMTNLLVIYDTERVGPGDLGDALIAAWATTEADGVPGKLIELPVIYGGERGTDLHAVAERAGLSAREVVRIHAAPEYIIFAPGSSPGFGYLYGLDPRIFMPRKQRPVFRNFTGTVSIGGMQTSISAAVGPSGWNAIGCLAVPVNPFDPHREEPSLVSVGDRIRFTVQEIVA